MFRSIPAYAAVSAVALLTLTAGGAAAAPGPVPGPKPPLEHIAISGGMFSTSSGTPGCFSGSGTQKAAYQIPAGAVVTGATAYVIDQLETVGISVTLNRHDMLSGGSYKLDSKFTTGAPGTTTLELKATQPAPLPTASAINVTASMGSGTCFKGAVVHFYRGTPPAAADVASRSTSGFAPDGAPADR